MFRINFNNVYKIEVRYNRTCSHNFAMILTLDIEHSTPSASDGLENMNPLKGCSPPCSNYSYSKY